MIPVHRGNALIVELDGVSGLPRDGSVFVQASIPYRAFGILYAFPVVT